MRQEITTYLSTFKDKLNEITKYLYDCPEESFKEHKTMEYITSILSNHNYTVKKNFMDISTSFYAEFGKGHPKICFICEYDGDCKTGHIYGNNLSSSISLAAAISLSKVITKTSGSIIVIGTPGELRGGSKITMHKQGAFNDLDAILIAKPHIYNIDNSNCPAVIPLRIVFYLDSNPKYKLIDAYSIMITFLSQLTRDFGDNCNLDNFSFNNSELTLDIKAPTMEFAVQIRQKVENLAKAVGELTDLRQEVNLYNLPCNEITKSDTLNRLFAHNLKECGLINLDNINCNSAPSSLGCISKIVPCLSAYISIVETPNIDYPSEAFAKETLSTYAQDIALKTVQALAFTGLDLLEKQDLINESKTDLFKNI